MGVLVCDDVGGDDAFSKCWEGEDVVEFSWVAVVTFLFDFCGECAGEGEVVVDAVFGFEVDESEAEQALDDGVVELVVV